MSEQTAEIPYFPAHAPSTFADPEATVALFGPVLEALADVVVVPADLLNAPTPCASYTVAELRDHVLGWLQHFATAVTDPDRLAPRRDPDAYRAADDTRALPDVVRTAAAAIERGTLAGVAGRRGVMSQSAMDGDAVLAMALGEYLVHGWDLARATGRDWPVPEVACGLALEFFTGMITPEYRSADGGGGFFGPEVEVRHDASALDRLLGFAGRDPQWSPSP